VSTVQQPQPPALTEQEALACALLLAGARAVIERRPIYVQLAADGCRLSVCIPPCSQNYLHVAPHGLITDATGKTWGRVGDLLYSSK